MDGNEWHLIYNKFTEYWVLLLWEPHVHGFRLWKKGALIELLSYNWTVITQKIKFPITTFLKTHTLEPLSTSQKLTLHRRWWLDQWPRHLPTWYSPQEGHNRTSGLRWATDPEHRASRWTHQPGTHEAHRLYRSSSSTHLGDRNTNCVTVWDFWKGTAAWFGMWLLLKGTLPPTCLHFLHLVALAGVAALRGGHHFSWPVNQITAQT